MVAIGAVVFVLGVIAVVFIVIVVIFGSIVVVLWLPVQYFFPSFDRTLFLSRESENTPHGLSKDFK